jgi:hypothetical protein
VDASLATERPQFQFVFPPGLYATCSSMKPCSGGPPRGKVGAR